MQQLGLPSLESIEARVCELAVDHLGVDRSEMTRSSRTIEDLQCDSLDLIDFMMALEDSFLVTMPSEPPNAVYKSVFTRNPFRICDLAEMVYLQLGSGKPIRTGWRKRIVEPPATTIPFSQLGGRFDATTVDHSLFNTLPDSAGNQFRRRTDGMRCIRIPSAEVVIGGCGTKALPDEKPAHRVELDSFVMDAEPVSTTAYCRFLNSINASDADVQQWILRDPKDDRMQHLLIKQSSDEWLPVQGCEHFPMILVSWYGASAYSLWANGADWTAFRQGGDFLPTESQWEYAARGDGYQEYPWGNTFDPASHSVVASQHERGEQYACTTLPMRPVHEAYATSAFGLHHMAGNVWHWCRDWFSPDFYQRPAAKFRNAWNDSPTNVRSERGGSWVGPVDLCRCSYRRGRAPYAMGRCLGFRCISIPNAIG